MRRVIQWLPAAALSVGPCAAYLVWAITRRKPIHIVCAVILNLGFWVAGPAILAMEIKAL